MTSRRNLDSGWNISRIRNIILSILIASAASYYSDLINDTIWEKSAGVACTALSILTGFFMTILSIIGNMDSIIEIMPLDEMKTYWLTYTNRIRIQTYGCFVMIIAVILSVLCSFFNDIIILRRFFIFFSVLGCLWAISFPHMIFLLYKDRYEYIIEVKSRNKKE